MTAMSANFHEFSVTKRYHDDPDVTIHPTLDDAISTLEPAYYHEGTIARLIADNTTITLKTPYSTYEFRPLR